MNVGRAGRRALPFSPPVWVCDAEWCLFVNVHPVFPSKPAEPKILSDGVSKDWSQVFKMKIYFLKLVNCSSTRTWKMGHVQAVWIGVEVVTLQQIFFSFTRPCTESTDASITLVGCVIASSRCTISADKSTKSDESNTQQTEVKFEALQVARKLIF